MTKGNGRSERSLTQAGIPMRSSLLITTKTETSSKQVNAANILTRTVSPTSLIITVTGSNNKISNRNPIGNQIQNGCGSIASSHTILMAKNSLRKSDAVGFAQKSETSTALGQPPNCDHAERSH